MSALDTAEQVTLSLRAMDIQSSGQRMRKRRRRHGEARCIDPMPGRWRRAILSLVSDLHRSSITKQGITA